MNGKFSLSTASKSKAKRPAGSAFQDSDEEVSGPTNAFEDGDEDPLDSFMAGVHKEVETQKASQARFRPQVVSESFERDEDDVVPESRFSLEDEDETKLQTTNEQEQKRLIEPLPRVDHSLIQYPSFSKVLNQRMVGTAITSDEAERFRQDKEISVSGDSIPNPMRNFSESSFDSKLRQEIERQGFTEPTAIQSQTIPIALSGRDILGLAKTGSGKTLAYIWPMILHVLAQPQMQLGDGCIGLVLAPTRELVVQIHNEAKKFGKVYNVRSVSIFGGVSKWEMGKVLKDETPEIIIATPGRMIDMVRDKATNLRRCTMVVLDEADRMFDMGFEYQMRSILQNIRPDRQTLMFSATMKKKIEAFARDLLTNAIRVVVGMIGQANPDIRQLVEICPTDDEKWLWLSTHIDNFAAEGKVLIFALSKADCDLLTMRLRQWFSRRALDIAVDALHGDKDAHERGKIMKRFRATDETALSILVATDLAARGLDVQDIRTVINYDAAKNIETYVHRIGRTGRMGVSGVQPGTAYTLLTPKESSFAVDLVQNLRLSQQPVSEELLALASRDNKWQRIRHFRDSTSNQQRSGLGTSGAGKAMTSAMLARETGGALSSSSSYPQDRSAINVNRAVPPPAPMQPSSLVRGFVRASQPEHGSAPPAYAYSQQQQQQSQSSQQPAQSSVEENESSGQRRKRSRWDS